MIKKLIIFMLICACFTSIGSIEVRGENMDNNSDTKVNDVRTVKISDGVTAKVSFGDSGCWIQKLKVSKNVKKLIIPDKIDGSPVVWFDYTNKGVEGDSDDEWTNIFGKKFESQGDELNPKKLYPANNKNITQIVLPDTITYIGKRSFAGLTSLSKIKLPKNLERIATRTFARCEKLKKIDIPNKVEDIDKSAFVYCKKLNRIHIEKGNKNYIEKGDVILKSDMKTVFSLSNVKKTLNIPGCVEAFDTPLLSNFIPRKIKISKNNKCLAIDKNCIYKKSRELVLALADNKKIAKISDKVKVLKEGIAWAGKIKKVVVPKSVKYLRQNWYLGLFSETENTIVFKSNKPPIIKATNGDNGLPSSVRVKVSAKSFNTYKKWLKKRCDHILVEKKKNSFYIF